MAVEDSGTPSSSSKNGPPTSMSSAQLLEQVTSALSSNDYESDSSFTDDSTYYQAFYSSNHNTLKYRHLKEDTHFIKARNRRYETGFGTGGDHRRQMTYPGGHYSAPVPNRPSPQRTFTKSFSTKWLNTRFVPSRAQDQTVRTKIPDNRSINNAQRSGPTPTNTRTQSET